MRPYYEIRNLGRKFYRGLTYAGHNGHVWK